MSDTPRMHSALMDAPDAGFANIWRVGCDIERELNTANDHIKRLEEAGDAILNAWLMPENAMEYRDWVALSADAEAMWYKAKEVKP